MATIPGLRPLRLGEILDVGIKLYLRHWRTLIGCVVWVVLPVQVLSTLVTLSIAPERLDFTATNGETGVSSDDLGAYLGAQIVVGVLQGVVFMLATAACFKAVSDAYLGGEPDARRSLGFALRRLPALLLLGILWWLGLAAAFIALIVPAIWLSVAWALAIPALLFEGVSPAGALGRSFRLVKGRWWRICGTLLVGVVLVSFLSGVLEGLLLAVPAVLVKDNDAVAALANIVAGTIGSVLSTPFTAAIIALLYYDQRVRKEGFDLQLLAAGLGAGGTGEEIPPAPSLLPVQATAEDRAAAPYWPPPPGWKPPERPPASDEAQEAGAGWQPPRPGRPDDGAGERTPGAGLWSHGGAARQGAGEGAQPSGGEPRRSGEGEGAPPSVAEPAPPAGEPPPRSGDEPAPASGETPPLPASGDEPAPASGETPPLPASGDEPVPASGETPPLPASGETPPLPASGETPPPPPSGDEPAPASDETPPPSGGWQPPQSPRWPPEPPSRGPAGE